MMEEILNEDPPFFMHEDFSLPHPSIQAIEECSRELSAIKDCIPATRVDSETHIHGIELANTEDRFFLTTIKKLRFPQGLEVFKSDSVEHIEHGLLARFVVYMVEDEFREVYFDIYGDSVKKNSRDAPNVGDEELHFQGIKEGMDAYEALFNALKRTKEREEEAEWYTQITNMDFVSDKTFEKILSIVRFYRQELCGA